MTSVSVSELKLSLDYLQARAQNFVIFDDAVMNDGNPVARYVRMRVALRRHAVRRPSRVRDADVPSQRRGVDRVLQLLDLPTVRRR